jgi:dynein heavy chain, axonemal
VLPPKKLVQVELAEVEAVASARKKEDEPVDPAVLQERLKYLVENITYEVFDYARRGLFEKHTLMVATMTAKVQQYLTTSQWGATCALKEVEPFKGITEDLELNVEAWREWLKLPNPEEQELPGDWQKKVLRFAKLLLVRALRSDRVTAALTSFIT